MEIAIAITIRPSNSLTPDQFQEITDKAAALNITPDQFVVDAILEKLLTEEKEAA